MAVLTKERDTTEIANGAKMLVLPVKGATTIYQGALVAIDANGFAIPATKAASLTAAGRAEETAVNAAGADGDTTIRVMRGAFVFANSATANKITKAHLLKPCYMEDDQTVSALATGSSIAGLVVRVGNDGVAVEIDPALSYPAPAI